MSDASGIGLTIAFSAGVVSFLSPCVLPLVGVAMLTGQVPVFSVWLLRTFPAFASIG